MRAKVDTAALNVRAYAGTHVVSIGLNMPQAATAGLLGFAIRRRDPVEDEEYWLSGFKTFESVYPNPPPGALVSSRDYPVQSFLWADYTAKPNRKYTYFIVPMRGKPRNLKPDAEVPIEVTTESEDKGEHAIHFNRGAAGSQAYARKFGVRKPKDVGPDAFKWLSRGLEEAILRFIAQANGPQFGLRVAAYEFSHMPVLKALKQAAQSGADVKIVYDAKTGAGKPAKSNLAAIKKAKIASLVTPRTENPSYISHNKFIVLLKNGQPIEVFTGSTNFTQGGIFGHSNVGHIVRRPTVAQAYLDYWTRLAADPAAGALRAGNLAATPDPQAAPPPNSITSYFSPRPDLTLLDWYATRMNAASDSVCLTAAFGVNKKLAGVLGQAGSPFLGYVLLEKPGETFKQFASDRDISVAVGAFLKDDLVYRWLREIDPGLNRHVRYIHTKYMLLDPTSDDPVVISGSANFSDASTKNNDENMLVIRGDTRVADVYLGEFMRLFNHFAFRQHEDRLRAAPASKARQAAYLKEDASWTAKHYVPGSKAARQRELFA
ncbi:MAG: hypothetical protein CHACPFDD_03086 [Phycisphaerae bacterium]|nr:hypothetical protein [Phycisphaerae bacterium]